MQRRNLEPDIVIGYNASSKQFSYTVRGSTVGGFSTPIQAAQHGLAWLGIPKNGGSVTIVYAYARAKNASATAEVVG